MNIIVANCEEHIYISDVEPMERQSMGAYFIRGDNISVVAELVNHVPKEAYGNPITPLQLH